MKITVRLWKNRKLELDGYPVYVTIRHKDKRLSKKIANSFPKDFDNNIGMVLPSHPDFDILYPYLYDLKTRAKEIKLNGVDDIDQAFDFLFKKKQTGKNFVQLCNLIFAEMQQQINVFEKSGQLIKRNKLAGNLKVYQNAVKMFSENFGYVSILDLDKKLLLDFKNSCIMRGNSKSTINNYLRTLRALYNQISIKYDFEPKKPFEGVFVGLNVKSYQTKKKYITKDSVKLLEHLNLPGKKQMYVDLALLQFYFGGCDLIDLYFLQKKQCQHGKIFLNRGKTTNDMLVEVFVTEKAAAILEKYQNTTNYVFDFRKDGKAYETFRRRYTRVLEEVQQELNIPVLPLGGKLGVKVFRHTFANIAKNLYLEPDLIRELMGHERDDVDNYYKDKFPEEVRKDALLKIIS